MIGDWKDAIAFVLEQEGGYTLDPNDPGGETNFGISKKAYPNEDIKNMTVDRASQIYERDYWIPCHCDQLPAPFAIAVFDTAVNQGTGTATKILQRALKLTADGIIGPNTLNAANSAGPRAVKLFLAERLASYARLMAAQSNLLVFAVNWSFRVVSLAELILKEHEL